MFGDKELWGISNKIRTEVFVKEQNVDPVLEYEHEEEGHFYLMFIDDEPVATARWRMTKNGIKLELFAMLKEYRNQGLGSALLSEVMNDVMFQKQKIYLHSQLKAVSFYERAGFVKKGETFKEAGIDHYLMEYDYNF
ncbi:MAG: GNAT family N-acetyltransferase [Bacteroidetes bacterium]|nr:GNAT family N-acetyltransferase [Bacteroidota bacterium]